MKSSRTYTIPAYQYPALRSAALLNTPNGEQPPYLQNTNTTEKGFEVIVHGDGKGYDVAVQLAGQAERLARILILPPENSASKHQGVEGEHLEFRGRLYHTGVFFHDEYGSSYVHRFADEKGNEYTWYTQQKFNIGDYLVKCTVKGHADYDDVEQTQITRAKLEEATYDTKGS